MARARNIKPGLFKNEILGVEDPLLTILFCGLWCLADKRGRLEDRPLRIKGEIFTYRENLDINRYLTDLVRLGFINRYSVDGVSVIQIINFEKHQNPHHTEKESELPVFSNTCDLTGVSPLSTGYTPADSGFLIPDSRKLIPDIIAQPPSGVSQENQVAPKKPERTDEPVGTLLTNKAGERFSVYRDDIQIWQSAYPAVDVIAQLRAMAAWLHSNPTKRKTARGMKSFINNWLSRAQNDYRHHVPVEKRNSLSDFVNDKDFRWDE